MKIEPFGRSYVTDDEDDGLKFNDASTHGVICV